MINLYRALIEKNLKGYKTQKSDFAGRHCPITHSENGQRHHFCTWLETLTSPAILTRLDPLPTATYFPRYLTHFPWNTSIITKMSKKSFMTGPPQKMYSFPGKGIHKLSEVWRKCVSSDAT
ncbi:hypothetical protein CEXT_625801 [Caerostris extrusa]|uniref:Uncharacterized protein n=1 Tax=Caerostris extrusa TaxID=172846 RepID=A0AAV4UGU3_CAEEX|nr:hypothetical protein CEXT_625801 [Caerostris extrusa]